MIKRVKQNKINSNPVKKYMNLLHKPKTFDTNVKNVYTRKNKHRLIKQEFL